MTRVALWPVEGPRPERAGTARAAAALMALQIPAVMHKRRDRECLEFLPISPAVRTT